MGQGHVTITHHNHLAGYLAAEHIDWTAATQDLLTTGKGTFASLNGINFMNFNTAYSNGVAEGRLQWNIEDGTLEFGVPGGNVNLQIGQEILIRIKNEELVQINNGEIVYASSAVGNVKYVKLANANNHTNAMKVVGIATENIAADSFGYITTVGLVRDFDTSAFSDGQVVYLSTTNGQIVGTAPTAPNTTIRVGIVVKPHATEGILYASIHALGYLSEISDVLLTSVADKDMLSWDNANSRWKNISPGAIDHNALLNYAANRHIDWTVTGSEDIYANRITEGSVTQHVGAIDHTLTLGYYEDQHIDWTVTGGDDIHNDRISVTSVIQHVISINHDQLLNYEFNQHIDWTVTGVGDIHNDRVTASSVTQHVGAIDHDSLLNYLENEHIDWTNSATNFATTGSIKIFGYVAEEHFMGKNSAGMYIDYDTQFSLGNGSEVLYFSGDTLTSSTGEINLEDSINIVGNTLFTGTFATFQNNASSLYERYFAAGVGVDTAKNKQALDIRMSTNGNMIDGFGTSIRFLIEDAGTEEQIMKFGAQRAGADNSGRFYLFLNNAGVLSEKFGVEPNGDCTATGEMKGASGHFGGVTDRMEVATDGSVRLRGAGTMWKDMISDLFGKRLNSTSGKVDYEWDENAIKFQSGGSIATAADRVGGNSEINHEFKVGTGITFRPHMHWFQEVVSGAVEAFVFTAQYRLQRNDAEKTASWTTITAEAGTADDIFDFTGEVDGTYNQITRFDDIVITCSISDTIQFRVARTDSVTGDVLVYFFDMHGEVDAFGSELEVTKVV